MMNRRAYTTEDDVLEELQGRLVKMGLNATKKQLKFLYAVIVRYINANIDTLDKPKIRLPHIGTLYDRTAPESPTSLTKKVRFTKGNTLKELIKAQNNEYKEHK